MTENPRIAFFDDLAQKWDSFEALDVLHAKLTHGLDRFGLDEGDCVLDIGCGTGNLTQALLSKLGPSGRVIAVDISSQMLEVARSKLTDERVTFEQADATALSISSGCVDHAFCFGVWPHFDEHEAVGAEILRVLRPGGKLHVWHLLSRDRVNTIHADAGGAVRHDLLLPAIDTAVMLTMLGFGSTQVFDRDDFYLVTATKPADSQPC
jgi:ubiquinone/menaquinone biosynthesis C-methylase UbiE